MCTSQAHTKLSPHRRPPNSNRRQPPPNQSYTRPLPSSHHSLDDDRSSSQPRDYSTHLTAKNPPDYHKQARKRRNPEHRETKLTSTSAPHDGWGFVGDEIPWRRLEFLTGQRRCSGAGLQKPHLSLSLSVSLVEEGEERKEELRKKEKKEREEGSSGSFHCLTSSSLIVTPEL